MVKYTRPEVEVIALETSDVILASDIVLDEEEIG